MVAWAVALPFSLVTIFKTRDSFRAGRGPVTSAVWHAGSSSTMEGAGSLPLHPALLGTSPYPAPLCRAGGLGCPVPHHVQSHPGSPSVPSPTPRLPQELAREPLPLFRVSQRP